MKGDARYIERGDTKYLQFKCTKGVPLLLRRWYEIMALYYVKSILTEISASRQEKKSPAKKQNHQNQIYEHMGHATDF